MGKRIRRYSKEIQDYVMIDPKGGDNMALVNTHTNKDNLINLDNIPAGGVRCNRDGTSTKSGTCVRFQTGETVKVPYWDINGDKQHEIYIVWQIRKGFRAKKTSKNKRQHDYIKAKKEQYDLTDPRVVTKLKRVLTRIFAELGISYSDSLGLVELSNEIDTACWAYNPVTKHEVILVNPHMLRGGVQKGMRIIKHEILHRAMYRKVGADKANQEVVNVALDACINRVLADKNGNLDKNHNAFCEWIYPKKSKKTGVAVCDSSLTDKELDELNDRLRSVWIDLYNTDKFGRLQGRLNISSLNPNDVYWILKPLLEEEDFKSPRHGGHNPFGSKDAPSQQESKDDADAGHYIPHCQDLPYVASSKIRALEDAAKNHSSGKPRWGGGYSNATSNFFDKWTVTPSNMYDDEDLAEWAKMMETKKALENVEGTILAHLDNASIMKAVPDHLTTKGQIMVACGFHGKHYPFYYCHAQGGRKKKALAFFDVSPSMAPYVEYMVGIIDTVESQCEVEFARNGGQHGAYGFAGSVLEMSGDEFEKFRKGEISYGASTSFDAVVEHMNDKIDTNDLDLAIIFTDGYSNLSQDNIDKFNASGKNCFTMYFTYKGDTGPDLESDLDKLNGQSFTLRVEPKESGR